MGTCSRKLLLGAILVVATIAAIKLGSVEQKRGAVVERGGIDTVEYEVKSEAFLYFMEEGVWISFDPGFLDWLREGQSLHPPR